jgi:hypothetical protein
LKSAFVIHLVGADVVSGRIDLSLRLKNEAAALVFATAKLACKS